MLVLHSATKRALEQCLQRPPQALLIVGAPGSGKLSLASYYASHLLQTAPESLNSSPYYRHIKQDKSEAITIEQIRQLQSFLTLKVPTQAAINRVVVIENAHHLTIEAQNAFLKTLEEPPSGTAIALTATQPQALLTTIQSRTQKLQLINPVMSDITNYFIKAGYEAAAINKALLISGGLPGLTAAVLRQDSAHPLFSAITTARDILQKSRFERLTMVDGLAKQKMQCQNVLFVLQQMADAALPKATTEASRKRWSNILTVCYGATELLAKNAQPKLVLTDLMLNL